MLIKRGFKKKMISGEKNAFLVIICLGGFGENFSLYGAEFYFLFLVRIYTHVPTIALFHLMWTLWQV